MAQPPQTPSKPKVPVIETKHISTPSAKGLASRNKSQNVNYLAEDVKADLVADIESSQSCPIDELLQYFLYLSLNTEKRAKMDGLQTLIEELEISLDAEKYNAMNAGTTPPDEGTSNTDGATGTKVKGQDKLKTLRQQRDTELQQMFNECMDKIVELCTDHILRKHLHDYACTDVKDETDRYAPYVLAANRALDLLNPTRFDSFREPSSLDVRFHRNDPKHISSKYPGMAKDIQRVPDVILTSRLAAQDAAFNTEDGANAIPRPTFEYTPVNSFSWHAIRSCHEFKLLKTKIMSKLPDNYSAAYVGEKYDPNADEISKDPLEVDVVVPETPDEDENEPSAKRARLDIPSNSGAGGSNINPPLRVDSMAGGKMNSKAKASLTRGPNSKAKGSQRVSAARSKAGKSPAKEAMAPKTQCGTYGLEMMSVAPGVHHAITCLIVDHKLWIFYYDRQGILQSYGMDFIRNLPRFLILLAAFQRFRLEDWGVISMLNPRAKLAHTVRPDPPENEQRRSNREVVREAPDNLRRYRLESEPNGCLDVQDNKIQLFHSEENLKHAKIDVLFSKALSPKPHTICGRAGAVFDAAAEGHNDIVCKIYNPEVDRQSEGAILQKIYKKVEEKKIDWLRDHLPTMLLCGDIPSCSTNRIRSMTNLDWRGYRTMRFLVFRKLNELTELSGEDFIKAWFEIVVCHAYLWDMGVHHGDPSLWNSMCAPDTKKGVLSDFDLATLEDMPRRPGHERTGTIPFMAIALLTKKYWDGHVQRMYHHELEAFLWILPFVFLRYPKGQAVRKTKVDAWMTPYYDVCRKEKYDFCFGDTLSELYKENALSESNMTNWKKEWRIVVSLIKWVSTFYTNSQPDPWEKDNVEEPDIRKSIRRTRKAFIDTCRLKLESPFPYICGYLDKLETSLSKLPVD